MRVVVQRVRQAKVMIAGIVTAAIATGYLLYVGFHKDDNDDHLLKMANKVKTLRLFDDDQGRINLDIGTIGGAVLAVSQFTLYAEVTQGNRPSFGNAMAADQASGLYDQFLSHLTNVGLLVQSGTFQAHMVVSSENDGPVTILVEM